MSDVQGSMSYVLCPMSYVLCPMSYVQYTVSYVLCPVSYIQCPISSVLYPVSYIQCPLFIVLNILCPMLMGSYGHLHCPMSNVLVSNIKILFKYFKRIIIKTKKMPKIVFYMNCLIYYGYYVWYTVAEENSNTFSPI